MKKKASSQVGIAIIVMALLLLLGGIFFDTSPNDLYTNKKKVSQNETQLPTYNGEYIPDTYLFYMKDLDIGRQNRVTESFPNVVLGSKKEFNTVYIGNSFRLMANPFTKNEYTIEVQLSEPKYVNSLLVYLKPNRIAGDQKLRVKIGNRIVSENLARDSDLPINIQNLGKNNGTIRITFELDKPKWYSLFNWNKMDVEDLRVVEIVENTQNNKRTLNFQVKPNFLEHAYLNLVVSCDDAKKVSKAIRASVNGFILAEFNPDCSKRNKAVVSEIPLNILDPKKNTLELETSGYYKVAYSIDKIYYNDQDIYTFTINSFNDIIDVVMYGDFDKELIDLRVNSQIFSLKRHEIVSIIPFLRFGVNEIEFLNKPVEIKELIVEKSEFLH